MTQITEAELKELEQRIKTVDIPHTHHTTLQDTIIFGLLKKDIPELLAAYRKKEAECERLLITVQRQVRALEHIVDCADRDGERAIPYGETLPKHLADIARTGLEGLP